LYAVKMFGERPLSSQDTLVINWGAWEKEDKKGEWADNLDIFMKAYADWRKEGDAPRLIWREMSPMHWGANGGAYSKDSFKETQTTLGCSPAGGPKQIEAQMSRKAEFPLRNSDMFRHAVRQAHLQIDGDHIEFLPIYRGSAERYEDHQPLSKYQKATFATVDCTHYCVHGNVHRFWNSAILSVIAGMKAKEISSALDGEHASSQSPLERTFSIGKTNPTLSKTNSSTTDANKNLDEEDCTDRENPHCWKKGGHSIDRKAPFTHPHDTATPTEISGVTCTSARLAYVASAVDACTILRTDNIDTDTHDVWCYAGTGAQAWADTGTTHCEECIMFSKPDNNPSDMHYLYLKVGAMNYGTQLYSSLTACQTDHYDSAIFYTTNDEVPLGWNGGSCFEVTSGDQIKHGVKITDMTLPVQATCGR